MYTRKGIRKEQGYAGGLCQGTVVKGNWWDSSGKAARYTWAWDRDLVGDTVG